MPPKLDRCVQKVMNSKYARSRWPDEKDRRSKAFAICRTSTGLAEDAHSGFLIDVSTIELSDAGDPKWVQLFPYDSYFHPRFGEIDLNLEKAKEMADHVNNRTRVTDLDIDFEHKEGPDGGRAAGWIVKAEAREDGLYGLVSWTKKAVQDIKDKAYRYFSPEYKDEWTDAKGVTHKNVLFGGALTNRPFLKNIAPINLSEHFAELDAYLDENDPGYKEGKKALDDEGRDGLDPKEIRKLLSLAEDASDEDVQAKIKQLQEPETPEAVVKLGETLGLDEEADETKLLSEVTSLVEFRNERSKDDEKAKKFVEDYPEEAAEMKRLKEDRTTKKLEEWTDGSVKLKDGTRTNRGIPPKLTEEVKTFLLSLPDEKAQKFSSLVERIIETGLVDLAEEGSSRVPEHSTDTETFLSEVKKFREENSTKETPISFREAVKAVSATKPELAKAWRDSNRQSDAS